MQDRIELSQAARKNKLEEMLKRFKKELKKQPEISDEEFMAEFEVSDEEYKMGLVLPGVDNGKGGVDE